MNSETHSQIGEFVVKNIKAIAACIIFICGIYIQHQSSMSKIEKIENDITMIRQQIDAQYQKLDNLKVDKAVFEATMRQFADMSADIRQIRDIMEHKHSSDYPKAHHDTTGR